ncbi:MAG: GNAT family N-acetyltransferase [Deltaproteobacteria bacterium]
MEILSRRFVLRDFTEADIAGFEAYRSDPLLHEFDSPQYSPPATGELMTLFRAWASAEPRLNYQLAILLRRAPEEGVIGCCGLRAERSPSGAAEIGIELAPTRWGRYLYAAEILFALADFGFSVLGLSAIYGNTIRANFRAERLAIALGASATLLEKLTPESPRGTAGVRWQIQREQWEARARADSGRAFRCPNSGG